MRLRSGLLVALSILAAGCSGIKYVKPATPLSKAVSFKEQDYSGGDHAISETPDKPGEVSRLPAPGAVDINSSIVVELHKDRLQPGKGELLTAPEFVELGRQRDRVLGLLGSLGGYLDARAKAVEAYKATLTLPEAARADSVLIQRFLKASGEYNAAERNFLGSVRDLWPLTSEKRVTLEVAWKADPQRLTKLQEFFQGEVDALNAQYKQLADQARTKGIGIRFEAFLEAPNATRTAVHLPGYDSLEEKAIRTHDRLGLALSDAELDRLQRAMDDAKKISGELSKVIEKTETLQDAVGRILPDISQDLATLAADIDAARARLKPAAIRDRAKKIADDFKTFKAAFLAQLKADVPDEKKKLLDRAMTAVDALLGGSVGKMTGEIDPANPEKPAPFMVVMDLVAQIKDIQAGIRNPDPATVLRVLDLIKALEKLIRERAAESPLNDLQGLGGRMETALLDAARDLADTARGDFEALVRKLWEGSALQADLRSLEQDAAFILQLKDRLLAVVGLRKVPATAMHVPEAVTVPLMDAPDTVLDLQRTPRSVNDTVVIRASLVQEDKVLESTESSFLVQQYGYHASLQPGVVLIKPFHLEGRPQEYEFTATLSWLHTCTPRPGDNGFFDGILRAIQPSAGFHVTFPNFSPDKSFEVGVGGTVAFWGDRLVAGVGYNLMNEGKRDGDWYWFFGTNLIPLLQTMQVLPNSSGGVRP